MVNTSKCTGRFKILSDWKVQEWRWRRLTGDDVIYNNKIIQNGVVTFFKYWKKAYLTYNTTSIHENLAFLLILEFTFTSNMVNLTPLNILPF